MSARRPVSRLALAGLATVALLVALYLLGRGLLSSPPLGHPGQLVDWVRHHDTAIAAFSILRLVALIASWYLLVIIALHLVAVMAHSHPLAAAARWVTLPPIRRALVAVAGVSLSATTAAAGLPGLPNPAATAATRTSATATPRVTAPGEPGTATMRPLVPPPLPANAPGPPPADPQPSEPTAGSSTATMRQLAPDTPEPPSTTGPSGSPGTATLRPLPRSPGTGAEPSATRPPPATPTPTPPTKPVPAPDPPRATPAPSTWQVAPGDNFWHIAEATLAHAWGRSPTDAEIEPYWQAVIERNRASLARPDHPELILVGQVFELPPAPAAP